MDDSVVSITSPGPAGAGGVRSPAATTNEIKPYKIHVSFRYLDLTKKKLELTRLPHELLLPQSREWEHGTPKSEIEPLVDYWLEEYSWRTKEADLNASLPQYRFSATLPSAPSSPLRVHFIHAPSPSPSAIPILLLPPFPLTNLSLAPLFSALSNPADPWQNQPFHIIAPSIPGLGFSDSLPLDGADLLEATAELFNALMLRLGYTAYICSATGSGMTSPGSIDYHLPRLLARNHADQCIGIHVIDPPLQPPTFASSPLAWLKFGVAKFFHAPMFGYQREDWAAIRASASPGRSSRNRLGASFSHGRISRSPRRVSDPENPARLPQTGPSNPARPAIGSRHVSHTSSTASILGLRAPNTLSYALCDSPVGLLSLVLAGLRHVSPSHTLSREETVTVTQLAWLPGPEGALRFWAAAVAAFDVEDEERKGKGKGKRADVPTAVTVFVPDADNCHADGCGYGHGYVPPPWVAAAGHEVVWSKRLVGRAGLVALERPETVCEGIRGLAREVGLRSPELWPASEAMGMTGVTVASVGTGQGPATATLVEESAVLVEPEPEEPELEVEVGSPTPTETRGKQLKGRETLSGEGSFA